MTSETAMTYCPTPMALHGSTYCDNEDVPDLATCPTPMALRSSLYSDVEDDSSDGDLARPFSRTIASRDLEVEEKGFELNDIVDPHPETPDTSNPDEDIHEVGQICLAGHESPTSPVSAEVVPTAPGSPEGSLWTTMKERVDDGIDARIKELWELAEFDVTQNTQLAPSTSPDMTKPQHARKHTASRPPKRKQRHQSNPNSSSKKPKRGKQSGLVPWSRKQRKDEEVNLRVTRISCTLESQEFEYKWKCDQQCWVTDSLDDDISNVGGEFLLSHCDDLTIEVRPNSGWLPLGVGFNRVRDIFEGNDIIDSYRRLEVGYQEVINMLCDQAAGIGVFTTSSR
ncbi:hypothetical protein ACJZ2D_016574 [Fusarium nematophilum]